MTRTIVAILLVACLSGCVNSSSRVSEAATSCEDQLANIPELESQIRLIEKSKQAGGYALSYGAAAAGYTTDVVIFVAEGVVKSIVYCPETVISAIAGAVPFVSCHTKDPDSKIKGSRFGKNIYRNTAPLREANYVPLSKAIRQTSACFASQGGDANVHKARIQLLSLRDSDLFEQLPEEERRGVEVDIERLGRGEE